MRWKMAAPSRLGERFNRWALRRGFPALAWLAPRLPRWACLLGARAVGAVVMLFNPRPAPAIAANLARILGEPPSSRRVRAAGRQVWYNFASYWVDQFHFSQLPRERAEAVVDRVMGEEHLRSALARGKGVLLLTAHLGSWELGGLFLGRLGLPLSVVYVPDALADVEDFRGRLRRATGVEEIPIRPGESLAALPVLRALRRNRVVALQGDRDFDDRGMAAPFFGAPAPFPRGPFLLASLTGAALVPVFVAYTSGYRFEVRLGEPLLVAAGADRDGAVREALGRWVAVLEEAVRRWPTQWYTFYDFWGESVSAAPGTARRRGELG
jgi:KDO2-lipid IV(A) lauroyltransferase